MPSLAASVRCWAGQVAQTICLTIAAFRIRTMNGRLAKDLMPRIFHHPSTDTVLQFRREKPFSVPAIVVQRSLPDGLLRDGKLRTTSDADDLGNPFSRKEGRERVRIGFLCDPSLVRGRPPVFLIGTQF